METITRDLRTLDRADRDALERLLGRTLGAKGQVIIHFDAGPPALPGLENPYQSPQSPSGRPRERFKNPTDKWGSLALLGLGALLLAWSVWLFAARHLIVSWPIGGGLGLMIIGWLKYSLSTRVRVD